MQPVAIRTTRLLLLISASLGACHAGPPPQQNVRPSTGYTAGDTTAFGPRLLNVDTRRQTVTFKIDAPAQVILVEVTPGVSAVPVGALTSDTTRAEPGAHTMKFVASIVSSAPRGPATWGSLDQADYDRCVSVRTRSLPKKRIVRTDSTGKTTTEPGYELDDPAAEVAVERSCEAAVNRAPANKPPPRPTRFLVLLASNTPLMLSDAITRFEGMRSIPTDVASSVEAVAAALYGDRNGVWSAHYVPWQ